MQTLEQARLAITREALPWVRREGAARVFLAGECPERHCTEPPRFGPRDMTHPQPEVACFLSGITRFWLGETLTAFGSGDFLVVPPGLPHYPDVRALRVVSALTHASRPTSLWITAYPQGASVLLMQMAGEMYEVSRSVFLLDALPQQLVTTLVEELGSRGPEYAVMVQAALLALLATALRCPVVPSPQPVAALPAAPGATPAAGLVAAARDYIDRHYSEALALGVLARHLFVSESHLSRQFHRETGLTVGQYITRVRVSAARELLQSDLPIYAVAALAGFKDPLYFSQVFRRAVGLTPTAFRASLYSAPR